MEQVKERIEQLELENEAERKAKERILSAHLLQYPEEPKVGVLHLIFFQNAQRTALISMGKGLGQAKVTN